MKASNTISVGCVSSNRVRCDADVNETNSRAGEINLLMKEKNTRFRTEIEEKNKRNARKEEERRVREVLRCT